MSLGKVAIVGSGIAGLAVAHRLRGQADITLFEAGDYFGGHTHTVDLTLPTPQGPITHGIDTGFLVFNERTYPQLIALFAELDVVTAKADMSFSAQVPGARAGGTLEWSGSTLSSVFAQRSNLLNPRFWRMLKDVLRFNQLATALAQIGERFTQVDNECARVVAMLREAPSYRSLIRSNRDFLYRNKRDLEPMMVQWDGAPALIDAGFWSRIAYCYRSLAPRYMATQTWPRGNRLQGDGTQKPALGRAK